MRVSLINGEVNLKRNGSQEWEAIRLNYPLVEGDTLTTGKDSRLEIQIDARNYLRLAQGSSLRIVTLRDEGIAVSLVEGTAAVRLAKFDRSKEYFEIDAPKSTLAAEKTGLYRIDVSTEGRVRLTVRDGGSARIYSDTSGFALRDGRSAELVLTGETAGDWELLAAAPRDAIDEWVNDRERFLAQRIKQDSRYFDEYVWGAEDLDAYGDWSYNDEYGWTWRPHASVISAYHDWAPYRHGSWTWVSTVRVDVGRLRTLGLGAVSLRTLDLSQQSLGLGATEPVQQEAKLVATGARRVCELQLLIRRQHLLVSVVVLPTRSTFAPLSSRQSLRPRSRSRSKSTIRRRKQTSP